MTITRRPLKGGGWEVDIQVRFPDGTHPRTKAAKTVNNTLTVLGTLLKQAVELKVIPQMPCTVRLLKTSSGSVYFYDFGEYERLVAAAKAIGSTAYVVVLLGGDAGLRAGEMRAMPKTDADVEKGQLRIEWNEWQGHISTTKGNRIRYVPMTTRLRAALRTHRHLRGNDCCIEMTDGR